MRAFVVAEIKAIGRDPALVAATLAESRRLCQEGIKRLKAERAALERQRRADEAELRRLVAAGNHVREVERLDEVQERVSRADRRLTEIGAEFAQLMTADINEEQVTAALGEFDALWAALTSKEQARVLALLIQQVSHDGVAGSVEITFHPTGIKTLAARIESQEETAA